MLWSDKANAKPDLSPAPLLSPAVYLPRAPSIGGCSVPTPQAEWHSPIDPGWPPSCQSSSSRKPAPGDPSLALLLWPLTHVPWGHPSRLSAILLSQCCPGWCWCPRGSTAHPTPRPHEAKPSALIVWPARQLHTHSVASPPLPRPGSICRCGF